MGRLHMRNRLLINGSFYPNKHSDQADSVCYIKPRDIRWCAALESVKLGFYKSHIEDTIAELTLDNLDSGGRFIQNSGAGVLALDSSNSSWDGQNVTGHYKANGYLMTMHAVLVCFSFKCWSNDSRSSDGSFWFCPTCSIYNDLEVISLNAWSDSRALHDFSNPLWPLNVMGNKEIVVSGEVRYSGLDGVHPSSDDVDVILRLQNGEQILSSASTIIGPDGKFNTSLTTPYDNELSGSELTLVPILPNIEILNPVLQMM